MDSTDAASTNPAAELTVSVLLRMLVSFLLQLDVEWRRRKSTSGDFFFCLLKAQYLLGLSALTWPLFCGRFRDFRPLSRKCNHAVACRQRSRLICNPEVADYV